MPTFVSVGVPPTRAPDAPPKRKGVADGLRVDAAGSGGEGAPVFIEDGASPPRVGRSS